MNRLHSFPTGNSPAPITDDARDSCRARGTQELPSLDPTRLAHDDAIAIAHDLRGPLSVVGLEVTMLEELLPTRADVRVVLRRIARNLTYLDNLVHDLLDVAAIDAARFAIHTEPTELCGLVAEVVDRTVSSRDLARVDVSVAGSLVVAADVRRIERVLGNLIQNALKYSAPPARVSIVVDRRADMARVCVSDAGPGMPQDEASRVFEKFRRARASAREDGVGLGLYVSRKIIAAHEGRIGVDSVVGRGSRFHFELPLLVAKGSHRESRQSTV
jgi:signal transduction histidine kinase